MQLAKKGRATYSKKRRDRLDDETLIMLSRAFSEFVSKLKMLAEAEF